MDERREHADAVEQPECGFETGQAREPEQDVGEQHVGEYSEGLETHPDEPEPKGRFSEGQEERHGDREETAEGTFATGQEREGNA